MFLETGSIARNGKADDLMHDTRVIASYRGGQEHSSP
jgi:hypothetical protein